MMGGVFAGLIFIGLFAIILYVAYLPNRKPVNTARAAERKAYYTQLHAEQVKAASTYAWVDQQKGVVRLPLDRAKELMVGELKPAGSKQ